MLGLDSRHVRSVAGRVRRVLRARKSRRADRRARDAAATGGGGARRSSAAARQTSTSAGVDVHLGRKRTALDRAAAPTGDVPAPRPAGRAADSAGSHSPDQYAVGPRTRLRPDAGRARARRADSDSAVGPDLGPQPVRRPLRLRRVLRAADGAARQPRHVEQAAAAIFCPPESDACWFWNLPAPAIHNPLASHSLPFPNRSLPSRPHP